jgi:pimeloyl-ACP methyl ester carboxylesterase
MAKPLAVLTEYKSVPGYAEPHTPKQYNTAFYLRYHTSTPANTILVLMPDLYLGASSFDGLARQLVRETPGVEVWAVDRRANQLEQRDTLRKALAKRDATMALDAFVTNYGQKTGFRLIPPADVSFLAYWGLEAHLADLHQIVLAARKSAPRVIVGGHSLGATLASLYVAREVEPKKTGQDFINGLLLLDGALGVTGGGGGSSSPTVADLEAGKVDPYNAALAEYFAKREARNLITILAPTAPASQAFLDLPATNAAVAGLYESPATSPFPLLAPNVGAPAGAHALPSAARTPSLTSLGPAPNSKTVSDLDPSARQIGWTTLAIADQPTDLLPYLEADVRPDTNATEWYYPTRLTLDLAPLSVSLAAQPGFVPNAQVTVPTLALGAGRGMLATAEGIATYQHARPANSVRYASTPGYNHMDMITANRDNANVKLIQAWLIALRTLGLPGSGGGGTHSD